MKRYVSGVSLLCMAVVVSSCDMMSMPDKMDQTNATTSEMNKTTSAMKQDISNTNFKIDKTNVQIGATNDSIHKQTLLVALKDMTDDENSRDLFPVPFGMLAGGKTFAETATADELMDWFYAQNKKLEENTPDDSRRVWINVFAPKLDASGKEYFEPQYTVQAQGEKKTAVAQTDWQYPTSYINEFNHQKDVIFDQMQVVAAFIPQAKKSDSLSGSSIEEIVKKEVDGSGGLREQTVYLMLNLRDSFTRGALLQSSLYKDKLKNLDQVKEANRLVEQMDYIAALPFSDRMGSSPIQIQGYLNISEKYVYARQAVGSPVASVDLPKGQDSYSPDPIAFNPQSEMNNPNQGYFALNSDNLTVTAIDQSDVRTKMIHYDPKVIQKDWKDLQRHFMFDLPKDAQKSKEAQDLLAKIKAHIK